MFFFKKNVNNSFFGYCEIDMCTSFGSQVTARFDGALPLWGISELKSNAVGKANRFVVQLCVRIIANPSEGPMPPEETVVLCIELTIDICWLSVGVARRFSLWVPLGLRCEYGQS